MSYHDNFSYPAVEPRVVNGIVFSQPVYPTHAPLKFRRLEFGLTQQQVADAAGITLRQYQRLESGERSMETVSMRIGLSVCLALQLDPYRFVSAPGLE